MVTEVMVVAMAVILVPALVRVLVVGAVVPDDIVLSCG